jgi:signal transduction histidine kinase
MVEVRGEGDRAVLEVSDTGPGIATEERRRIFERFYRGDPAHGRGGTGLGLALVRSIVEVHGGRVACESRPGGGSLFRVTLPRVPVAS